MGRVRDRYIIIRKLIADTLFRILLYRATGHNSSFFILQENADDVIEIGSIEELGMCAVGFARIVCEGRVQELEKIHNISFVYADYINMGERFKTYMNAFKRKEKFAAWDYVRILDLRYEIFQVVHTEKVKADDPPKRE